MSYTIDLYRFMLVFDGSRVRNAVIGAWGNLDFSNIPDTVVTDGLTDSLRATLVREYARLGGDPGDCQNYLDFLASFVQMNVRYSGKVYIDETRMG